MAEGKRLFSTTRKRRQSDEGKAEKEAEWTVTVEGEADDTNWRTGFSGGLVWSNAADPEMRDILSHTDLPSGVRRVAPGRTYALRDDAIQYAREVIKLGYTGANEVILHGGRKPLPAPRVSAVIGAELTLRLINGSDISEAIDVNDLAENGMAREAFIEEIIEMLQGSYTDPGVKEWFTRRRYQLCDKRPIDMLAGAWRPEDEGPQQVHALAVALGAPLAT